MLTMAEIQSRVAAHYQISRSDMLSPSRYRSVARPRAVAIALCRVLTTKSSTQIGRAFNRDHSTVLDRCRAVIRLCDADPAFNDEIARLAKELGA